MTVKRLIEFFETYQKVPVEIKDIRDQCIESYGVQDEIRFHPVEMDPDLVIGILVRYNKREAVYGHPKRCALIIYNSAVPIEYPPRP